MSPLAWPHVGDLQPFHATLGARIDAWPEKGVVGGQSGPNRNGRRW